MGKLASPRILYLHGFRSSPASWKIQLLGERLTAAGLADCLVCPALSHIPNEAIAQAETLIRASETPPTLIGSSLGGFYATWLAEKHGLRAVLINPAVIAPLSLSEHLGTQTNLHTGETFEFTAAHIEELRALEVAQITASRYLLLVETGDEVLDYRTAVARYAGCQQRVLEGGDHSFTRFPQFVPQILEFCGL